jgi:hypothetical protein
MARGEFKIVKFALSDEEINYETYSPDHPSGSAFSDLQIMQTPILESFTNNTSLMKTKLISINRNNILYLPIFRINDRTANNTKINTTNTGYLLSANDFTDTRIKDSGFGVNGVLPFGANRGNTTKFIFIDQGMDTGGSPDVTQGLESDLVETAFLIRADHRLLRLHRGIEGYPALTNSFIDDDAIASYYVPLTDASVEVAGSRTYTAQNVSENTVTNTEMFDGPIGTRLKIFLQSSIALQTNSALFDELGTTVADATNFPQSGGAHTDVSSNGYKFIDTVVNIVGVTTGYSLDIPVRILRVENT